jgi:hypothetical protein
VRLQYVNGVALSLINRMKKLFIYSLAPAHITPASYQMCIMKNATLHSSDDDDRWKLDTDEHMEEFPQQWRSELFVLQHDGSLEAVQQTHLSQSSFAHCRSLCLFVYLITTRDASSVRELPSLVCCHEAYRKDEMRLGMEER